MRTRLVIGAIAAFFTISGLVHAQNGNQPGVVTSGASGVIVNGKPAARSGDTTSNGGPLVEGVPNVLINGKPAVVTGDRTHCGGKAVTGSHGVFVNGKPMVREGDQTSGCAN
ncbi:PAAR domain-containing protein [Bradyrhizobium genosp. P]|uniref:PAAR domain-containing protein n=1 Tax=Bradyrhizobium genosp. P TaxID=83641 RepID=UPI003CE81557